MPEALDTEAIRRALLAHYDARARELPWRRETDPYRIWVSEVMLQQTRVETAIPYYERWLERFPTLEALAEAPIDDVLRAWAGLGYYRRAHNLHRAANVVRERHHGELPDDPDALRRLPGIGDYTAGAIASIAFGRPEPAVDGNVRRVLCRLHDLPDPGAAELRRLAAALVPEDRPGDFNQALMELGATLCTPRAPRCPTCPLAAYCRARAAGTQLERPLPKPSKPIPEDDVGTAVVISEDGALLLVRRPDDGLLAGLWEFPGTAVAPGEAPVDAARRAAAQALGGAPTGVETSLGEPEPDPAASVAPAPHDATAVLAAIRAEAIGSVVHTFSHRRTTYHAFRFRVAGSVGGDSASGRASVDGRVWVAPGDLAGYALSAAQRRIFGLLPDE